MMPLNSLHRWQLIAFKHGLFSLLLGLITGVVLIFSVLGEVSLRPWLQSSLQIPGEVSIWRGAHAGALMNGVMCIVLSLGLPYLKPSEAQMQRVCLGLVIMVWGNGIFYVARAWGNTRGLAFDSLHFGGGNVADTLAIVAASVAMVSTFYAVIVMLRLLRTVLASLPVGSD